MLKRLNSALWVAMVATLTFMSCQDPKNDDPNNPAGKVNRTMIMYMVADNSLYRDLIGNINQMEQGFVDGTNGTLLVYLYPKVGAEAPLGNPKIYKIQHDEDSKVIKSKIVKEYTDAVRHDPLNPTIMRSVIEDAMKLAPADSYAIGFSSHSTGWVPVGTKLYANEDQVTSWANFGKQLPATRTFGEIGSYKTQMEIYDMAEKALPQGVKFDFIFFDACLMGGVEVAYQLRNNTEYMLFSSTEVLASGFPYPKMVPMMFEPVANVVGMAGAFAEYYGAQDGMYQSGTVSVIETAQLEALAAATKKVTQSNTTPTIKTEKIFYFTGNLIVPLWFDLEDYIAKVWPESPDLPAFRQALQNAVAYQWYSQNFFDIPILSSCGMTSFVPQQKLKDIAPVYVDKYSWSKDSGLDVVTNNTIATE